MSAVRYVLARAAENGFFEAVVPASAPFDPFLRASIRKGARRVFSAASTATKITDEAHCLRLAFLTLARVAVSPDDVEGVRAAFEASKTLEPKRGRAFWPITYGALVVIVVASVIGGFILFFPSPRSRFAHSAFGEALGEGLTDWVVGVSHKDIDRQDKGHALIMTLGVKRQIGEGSYNLLGTALEQSKAAAFASRPTTRSAKPKRSRRRSARSITICSRSACPGSSTCTSTAPRFSSANRPRSGCSDITSRIARR